MNFEQLRKQAKELVRRCRAGNEEALARVRAHAPARERVILADAQLTLAREHGYRSWPALVAAAEASADTFVVAATEGRKDWAERLLAVQPELERDRWAALVLGRGWEGDANEVGGPRSWPPLCYVCRSVFASAALARDLLGCGADPNAVVWGEYEPVSALYGAAGVLHDPELTRALLEAGADPNGEPRRGDALYHSVQADDTACLELLLEHGADPRGTNALLHALDYERLEHVRLLLDAGADPNEGAALVHAVRRGRSLDFVRLLVERGAALDRRGGEWSTAPRDYKTAYQNAVLRGRDDVVELLAELGASTELMPEDGAVAALARGEHSPYGVPETLSPDAQEAIVLSALNGRTDVVVDAVGPNFFGHFGGGPPGTLLHHAAWQGKADVVRRLLARSADPSAGSGADFDTPLAWAVHGARYNGGGGEYVAVAEALVDAGAELERRFVDEPAGALTAWLEERL